MEDAGQKLKKRREELKLRYRDVEELSEKIASLHKNDEYLIAISRLADIENRGVFRRSIVCTRSRQFIGSTSPTCSNGTASM